MVIWKTQGSDLRGSVSVALSGAVSLSMSEQKPNVASRLGLVAGSSQLQVMQNIYASLVLQWENRCRF